MSASLASAQASSDNQLFWRGIARLPAESQRSFWDAGHALSQFIGENPNPRILMYDTRRAPPGAPWWEKILFYLGQSEHNRAVANLQMAHSISDGAGWIWGALQGDFNKSPTTGQIVTGGVISLIPGVDQVCDVRDVIANCLDLSDETERQDKEKWLALALSCFGFIPEIGSAVKTAAKVALKQGGRLIDLIKHMEWIEKSYRKLKIACPWGFAPLNWLRKFDWLAHARAAGVFAKKVFLNALAKTEAAARYAFGAIKTQLQKLIELFKAVSSKIADSMAELGRKIKAKVDDLIGRTKKETGNYDATPGGPNKHGQGDKEPPRALRPKSNYSPPLKARHSIRNVKQGGVKKSKNTVAEPHIDMNSDVSAINRGEGTRNGNHFSINGRTYELTNGDHLVPHSGPGFHDLSRGEFDALGIYNKFGDSPQARIFAQRAAGQEGATKALEVWRLGQ